MWPRASAVIEDFRVNASHFFQGIGKDGQAVEGSGVVNALGKFRDYAAAPSQPEGIDGHGPEWIAEDVAQEDALRCPLDFAVGAHFRGYFAGRKERRSRATPHKMTR